MAMIVTIAVSLVAYAWATRDEGADAEKNQEIPSDVTKFKAVVNGAREVDVVVHVDISSGLTEEEAELIAEAAFVQVMEQNVMHLLETLAFDDDQIEAHYSWGYDESDMGHVFDMAADLTTLQMTVSHCF